MPSQQQVKWSQLRVGITVLVASVTLAVLIFLMSGTIGVFTGKIRVRAYFENAAGLTEGAPVRLQGVDIGNVRRIRIARDRQLSPVEVTMKVSKRYIFDLRKDSRATLSTAGVLGSTFVDLDSSHARGPQIQDDDVLETVETPDLQDVIKASQGTLQRVDVILAKLNDVVTAIQTGKGSVGRIINDPELYNRANATVAELQRLVNQVTSGQGSIGKLLYDDELYRKINDSVDKLNRLVNEVDQGQGTVGKLLKDPTLYNNANQTIAKANRLMDDINAGRGTLGKFAKDEEFARKIDKTIANLEEISNRLSAGEGSAGLLFKDPALYNNADQMLIESRNLVKAVRENPKKYLTIHFKIF